MNEIETTQSATENTKKTDTAEKTKVEKQGVKINPNKLEDKTLYSIIVDVMKMDFNTSIVELAALAGIKKSKFRGTYEQNMLIREKLIKGEIGQLKNFDNSLTKFSEEKQTLIKAIVDDKDVPFNKVSEYIGGLSEEQITKLEDMDPLQFSGFLRESVTKISNAINTAKKNGIDVNMVESGKIYLEIKAIDARIKAFLEKHGRDASKMVSEEDLKNSRYVKLQERALEITHGDKEKANEITKTLILEEKVSTDTELKNDKEFQSIVSDTYEKSESWGIDVKEVRSEEFYTQAQTWYQESLTVEKEEVVSSNENSSVDGINDIMMENEVIKEKLNIKTLVADEDKDTDYYANLKKLYPELDNLIAKDTEIQKLTAIKNPTEKEKTELEEKIKDKVKTAEPLLLGETNSVIQEQAVTTCMDTLKSYMDIDLTEQENVLQQFALLENKDIIKKDGEDVVLDINGTVNGKKLKLSYNLTDGTLRQDEFLSKDGEQMPFAINDPVNGKKEVTGITLPKFQDFVDGAQKMDYKALMGKSASLDDYKNNVASELKSTVKKEGVFSAELEKDMFEKNVIKDMAAQDIFIFMGKDKDMKSEMLSKEEDAIRYDMYTLLYNSINYYTVDELKTFRASLTDLTTKKESYLQNLKANGVNQEKYLLGLLGNPKILADKEFQGTKNSYALFFDAFKTKVANIPIMDLTSLKTYITKSELTENTDISYLPTTEMQTGFTTAISEMEDNMSLANLETTIENLPETKKSV